VIVLCLGYLCSDAHALVACDAATIRSNEGCAAPPSTTLCTITHAYDISGMGVCVLDFGAQPVDVAGTLTVFSGLDLYAANITVHNPIDGDDGAQVRLFATGNPDAPGGLGNITTSARITSDASTAGTGGGTIVLTSYQGAVTVGAFIRANGATDNQYGGGDGGSVTLSAARTVTVGS